MCTNYSTRNRAVVMNHYAVQTLLMDRNAFCPCGPDRQDYSKRSRLYNPDPKYQCHADLTCHQFDSIPKDKSCGQYGAPEFNCCGGGGPPATTIPCVSTGGGCYPPGDNDDCQLPPPRPCQRRRIKPPGCCTTRPTYKDLIDNMQCCPPPCCSPPCCPPPCCPPPCCPSPCCPSPCCPSPCCPPSCCPPPCCPPPCCPPTEEEVEEQCDENGENEEEQGRQPESCYSLVVPPEMGDSCGSRVTYNFGPTGITRSMETRGGNKICTTCQDDCVMLETHKDCCGGCAVGNTGIRVESKYTPSSCCESCPLPCCPPPPCGPKRTFIRPPPCYPRPCPPPCPPPPCRNRTRVRCPRFVRTTVGPDIGCGCQSMEFRPPFRNP